MADGNFVAFIGCTVSVAMVHSAIVYESSAWQEWYNRWYTRQSVCAHARGRGCLLTDAGDIIP